MIRAAWQFDYAIDVVLAGTRVVPNNDLATQTFPADRNIAPGDYKGTLLTFELGAAAAFCPTATAVEVA